MIAYEFFIPELTLVLGISAMIMMEIGTKENTYFYQWLSALFALVLASLQQIILYRIPTTTFARGGMVLDGFSQIIVLAILFVGFLVILGKRQSLTRKSPQALILFMTAIVFGVLSAQANRLLFGVFSIIGFSLAATLALVAESQEENQSRQVIKAIPRIVLLILLGLLIIIISYLSFSETQIDEIKRQIHRPNIVFDWMAQLQVLVLFFGAFVLGIPPFHSLMAISSIKSLWRISVGMLALQGILGINIMVRWGLMLFSKTVTGGGEIEPSTTYSILQFLQIFSAFGLIVAPFLAYLSRDLKRGFQFFLLNPFLQIIFAFSLGHKETAGFGAGQIFSALLGIGLFMYSATAFMFKRELSWSDWSGVARKNPERTMYLLMGLMSVAGLPPFYGSLLIYKTLCVNSPMTVFLVINLILSGFYIAQLLTTAFQGLGEGMATSILTHREKVGLAVHASLLIFVGIFWEPLYKYGAYSISILFGEM